MKEKIIEYIEQNKNIFFDISKEIWEIAECRYNEFKSAKLFLSILEKNGFEVETNIANIPTAFLGKFGKGRPYIGIIGEYDALEGLSQKEDTFSYCPKEGMSSGHGCGHNILGTAALLSVCALKENIEKENINGTIFFIGCPAEENGSGKTFMVREGVFNDFDIILSWHPECITTITPSGCYAHNGKYYKFKGKASHAAAAPELGRSALDAVELMNVGSNFLREHIPSDAKLHYAITNSGGMSPNIVQENAEVFYTIRAPKMDTVISISKRVDDIAKGAALMTGTSVTEKTVNSYADIITNSIINKITENVMEEILPIEYTEEEKQYALKFRNTFDEFAVKSVASRFVKEGISEKEADTITSEPIYNSKPYYIHFNASTDVGDVSHIVPTGHFTLTCYSMGTALHTWQTTAQGLSTIAQKGLIAASKILALTALNILIDSETVIKAKEEFNEVIKDNHYICGIPDDVFPI